MDQNRAKTYFWVLLDVLIAAIILVLVFVAAPTARRIGNSVPSSSTITVSAEGKATVSPDLAQSSFSVVSRGKNPEELADMNNQKITAVIQFVKSEGIAAEDIKTTGYNLSPDYRYDAATERNFITGYTLTQTVMVKMRDFKKIAVIIGGLTPLGVNQISGISFTVEDPEKFLAEARAQAFERAKKKAAEMAEASGARLGRVLNVGEFQGGPVPYFSYAAERADFGSASKIAATTIEPGTEEIKNQVTITYELQ